MGSTAQDIKILDRKQQLLPETAIQELKSLVKGEVIVKGEAPDDVYRAALDRWNKAWIQEAAFVVFCETDEDVAACLMYVQKWDLDMTIAAGRHSHYGASSTTGLVIDLRKMRKVEINLEKKSVTAQGGCLAADLEKPLEKKGYMAVFGANNETGIGGLTLGGGTGFLSGQYGMTIDNLLSAKVVLADGRIVKASETTNSDLFWGIRGGGSNFGVVTEFTYKIHKLQGDVFFGIMAFSPDKTKRVLGLMDTLRADIESTEGKLVWMLAVAKLPGQPNAHTMLLNFYDGPEEVAKKFIAPVLELEPFMNMTKMRSYTQVTDPMPVQNSSHNRVSSSNANLAWPFDAEAAEALIEDFDAFLNKHGQAVASSKAIFEGRSYRATAAVDRAATAYWSRGETMFMAVEAEYDDSVSDKVIREDVKAITDRVKAFRKKKNPDSKDAFNFNVSAGSEKVKDAYGENYPRLRELKRKYDPDFVFNKWYPIPPAEN